MEEVIGNSFGEGKNRLMSIHKIKWAIKVLLFCAFLPSPNSELLNFVSVGMIKRWYALKKPVFARNKPIYSS